MMDIKKMAGKYFPHMIFFTVAIAITLPFFLHSGFIFLLDTVWAPNIQLSDYLSGSSVTSLMPLVLIFKFLSFFLPVDFIQKAFLFFILYLCGYFMFLLAEKIMPRRWAILAGIIYILNPYVFERFLAGQILVLLGYAFFPFVILLFLRLIYNPRRRYAIQFALAFAIYPLLSQHWAYISFWFLIFLAIIFFIFDRGDVLSKENIKTTEKNILLFAIFQIVLLLIVNSFWLINLSGSNNFVAAVTLGDFRAFPTQSDPKWGIFFNVLSLYGFWQNAYFLPKDMFSYWWVLTFIILIFSSIGIYSEIMKRNVLAIAVAIAFIPALFMGVGYGSPITARLCDFLFYTLPGFGGLRETEKLVGFLAFAYAIFFPLGVRWAAARLKNFARRVDLREYIFFYEYIDAKYRNFIFPSLFVLVVSFLSVNNMFLGFNGQVHPYDYPASWNSVENILSSDHSTQSILFLPWHGYFKLDFAGNMTVANPATVYFSANVIAGKDLDSVYLTDSSEPDWDAKIFDWVQGVRNIDDDSQFLKSKHISYIVLAKTSDWERYGFLDQSQKIKKIFEAEEIVLYKVVE